MKPPAIPASQLDLARKLQAAWVSHQSGMSLQSAYAAIRISAVGPSWVVMAADLLKTYNPKGVTR